MPRYTQQEIDTAAAKLREWLKPGDTISTVSRHTSRSGMSRSISLFASVAGELVDISYHASRVLGDSIDNKHGGIRIGGCGMDMGFALVYNLSSRLFPDGFGCIGEVDRARRCPSCDHSNGDRDYTPHRGPALAGAENPPADWEDCGQCGCVHPAGYTGDCRDDSQRWPPSRPHWHRSGGYALRHRWI